MADLLGMSASNYTKIEAGARKLAQGWLDKVVHTFRVSEEWLLEGKGSPPEPTPPAGGAVVNDGGVVYPTREEDRNNSVPHTVEAAISVIAKQFHVPEAWLRKEVLAAILRNKEGGEKCEDE